MPEVTIAQHHGNYCSTERRYDASGAAHFGENGIQFSGWRALHQDISWSDV
jgi:hypothetical protein